MSLGFIEELPIAQRERDAKSEGGMSASRGIMGLHKPSTDTRTEAGYFSLAKREREVYIEDNMELWNFLHNVHILHDGKDWYLLPTALSDTAWGRRTPRVKPISTTTESSDIPLALGSPSLEKKVLSLLKKADKEGWDGESATKLESGTVWGERGLWTGHLSTITESSDIPPAVRRSSLKRKVFSLLKKASKEGWDGEGATKLESETVEVAQELVDRFPIHVMYREAPDVDVTPHGEVDFDWVIGRDRMLTVSVLPSREIAFSGLFRGARVNGREPWEGTLPPLVNCCFERLGRPESI